jgi:hypothetical protein
MQRLMGASLLIFNNKCDVQASMDNEEVRKVRWFLPSSEPTCSHSQRVYDWTISSRTNGQLSAVAQYPAKVSKKALNGFWRMQKAGCFSSEIGHPWNSLFLGTRNLPWPRSPPTSFHQSIAAVVPLSNSSE